MKYAVAVCLLIALCLTSGPAEGSVRLSEQAVTYTNFNFVRYATASLKRVYFATTNGVIIYNKDRARWDQPLRLPREATDVLRLWVDTFDEVLYIETPTSYYEYDVTLDAWFPLIDLPQVRNPDVRHLSLPRNMIPPIGFNYSADGDLIDPSGRSYAVTEMIDDGSGTLWIGTWGYGVAKANATTNTMELLPYGLLQSRVNAMYADGPQLFVSGAVFGDYRTGITVIDREENSFDYIETGVDFSIESYDINCLEGDDESIYVGTPYGLYVFDRGNRSVREHYDGSRGLSDDNVISLYKLGDSLFIGTASGLTLMSFSRDSIFYVSPEEFSGQVIYALEPSDKYMWIGSENGAYRFRLNDGALQRFRDPSNILFSSVYAIERFENFLWLAADDGVVQVNLRTADVTPYREQLYNRGGRALAVNADIAAISSDNGVTFIFHGRSESYTREFTIDDGLASDLVFSLRMDGRYLWIGTDEGLTRFLWDNPRRVD
ncbi:hypothetical protein GF420_09270 [candidate division GN15 bacterium]|nr:hypothetical protein [candidate division GN15 bacterium]